ncbi:MAG: hypothetical protein KDB21_01100 [Acidimicrobiales bacterium]|nr:hypothetical protein [Acidimicrobiales bacterium]
MRRLLTPISIALLALLLAACGSADTTSDAASEAAPTELGFDADADADTDAADDVDLECAQGQAFPDDPEFREAMCLTMDASVDVLRRGGEADPSWAQRIGEAVLVYATDRDAALDQLAELRTEMDAA